MRFHERNDVFDEVGLEVRPPTRTADRGGVATTAKAAPTNTATTTATTPRRGRRITTKKRIIGLGRRCAKGGLLIGGDRCGDFGDPFGVTEQRNLSLELQHRLHFGANDAGVAIGQHGGEHILLGGGQLILQGGELGLGGREGIGKLRGLIRRQSAGAARATRVGD